MEISKQSIYQYHKRQVTFNSQLSALIQQVDHLRSKHPGCGVEKMYYALQPDFIGRDRFIDIFMQLGYGLKTRKNPRRTTYSTRSYYPNLIKGLTINSPSTVWQSDITYLETRNRTGYAVFIIDVYNKMIVSHQVSNHMRATANIQALKQALARYKPPKYHHSDRGSQ